MALQVRKPEISTSYGELLPRRRRAAEVKQGVTGVLEIQFLDDGGNPLSTDDPPHESEISAMPWVYKARFREAVYGAYVEVDAEMTDPATATIRAAIPASVAANAGIYDVSFGVLNPDGTVVATNEIYLLVTQSAWYDKQPVANTPPPRRGPPTIDTLRLGLKDSEGIENELLETLHWDLAEMCLALVRTVEVWNDTPPPVRRYTTITFPYKDVWTLGAQYFLFEMAEEHYRRNKYKYVAGGTSIDDKNRDGEYGQIKQLRMQQFNQALLRRKGIENMSQGYGMSYGMFPG